MSTHWPDLALLPCQDTSPRYQLRPVPSPVQVRKVTQYPYGKPSALKESLFGRIQIAWRAFLVESRFFKLKPNHASFEVSLNFYLLNRYRTPVPGLVLRSRSRPFLAGPGAPVKFEGSPSVGVTPVSLVNNLKKISHLLFLIKLFYFILLFYHLNRYVLITYCYICPSQMRKQIPVTK